MNNEPVAWMETYKGEPNNLDWDKNNLYCEGEFHNVVPLYTHPVKELTNNHQYIAQLEMTVRNQQAEIEALKQSKFKDDNKVNFELTDEDIDIALYVADITLNNLSDGDISMERIKAFVRTILRKASEKCTK